MSEIRPCLVVVQSVQGETPGLAAGITYTCAIAFENGDRIVRSGIKPDWPRWATKIDAAEPGSRHPGFMRSGGTADVLSAWILELPHIEACAP